MGYQYLNNVEIEEALDIYLNRIKNLDKKLAVEEIDIKNALGRVTSEAVYAGINSPHYNACAMDGIALCAKSTFGATESTPVILKEGIDFVRVDTGDPLPPTFDAVVMIEEIIDLSGSEIKLLTAATPWQHIRQVGEDVCASEMIVTANTKIEPASIGALIAGGILKVKVWKRPLVGIIPTGDEIVKPSDSPKTGEIIEFNSAIFSSMLTQWEIDFKVYEIIPDRFELIKDCLNKASQECDLVVLNAGSSAGREDFSAKVIESLGEVYIHGIAIKPGKPTILGMVNNCPAIGVPGYPVSGIMVMERIVKPVIEELVGLIYPKSSEVEAVLSKKVVSSLKYKEFVRMKLGYVSDKLIATPLNRGAGVITSFVKADGILEIPLNTEGYELGQTVNIHLLRNVDEIKNTLTIIGSHDPLIDVATDIMRKKYRNKFVSSAHVGSMGGLMAIKRGEAHLAGIHLLDETNGSYNKSYIKRYFPDTKVLLIQGVKRIQGLMVACKNPKGIRSLTDLKQNGIRYVNRQKGAGTRILLDYLLKQNKIDPDHIYGYDREEFTHIAVATQVASGNADTGMGILAAAKIYGLDFIPICEEQYDFIVPESYLELEMVKNFIHILKSHEFKEILKDMGGYNLENTGEILPL